MSERIPVAYAVVRVGERFHHHEIFRCEEDADAVARMLIADTGADWRVWPLVYGRKPKAIRTERLKCHRTAAFSSPERKDMTMADDVDEGSAAMRGSDAYQRPDVVWACQWGRWFSIHDTAAEAQEYGLNRGDDEPFWVFPFRAMRWIPVDEQMPEKGVPVLVAWTDGGSASVAASISLAWIVGDVWRSVEGGHRLDGVTHWMATPDHPHDCE